MALLDRFRTQTRHNNPDPAVRLAYVEELPLEERELIAAMAREDADPRIRRAAVAKLLDPASLATVARDDGDDSVRAKAVEMLRDIALDAFEGTSEADSFAAVDALADPRALSHVAKSAPRETVAMHALARLTDPRAAGSVARHAASEAVRLAALAAVQEHDELLAVAINSEFKDSAVAAVDRLDFRDDLEAIATRAKNKSAAKRARAVLREREERAAAEAANALPPPPDPADVARAERHQILQRLDALQLSEDADAMEAAVNQAEAAWGAIQPEADVDTGVRFSAAVTQARGRASDVRQRQAERAEADAEAARRREEQQAAEAAERREAEEKELTRRRARLTELAAELTAAADDPDLATARRRTSVARGEWKDLTAGVTIDAALAEQAAAAEARIAQREHEAQEHEARARKDALNRMHQLIGRVEPLAARPDVSLKAIDRALRDIRAALGDMPPLPTKADFDEMSRRLKEAQAALVPKAQELREVTEWQRWANVGIQEQLCTKMEALKTAEDPDETARQIRDLQQQWRQAADVPRAQGEALWRRFKAAHDEVWARCEAHFAAQAEARAANLTRKIALCERAEALADSTNWIQTADAIKQLQAEWKTIGPVTRGQEKAIWERFRSTCDRFFTRRHEDLAQRKSVWAENLAKKEALCVRAEQLAQSTDWDAAAAEIKQLQADWKTIGPVKKSRSEAIWQRFRAACDAFFARYAQRHDVARAERVAAREAVCAELESLAAPPAEGAPAAEPPADLVAQVRALRGRWQQEIAARGVDRDRALALDQRFTAAFSAVVSRFPAAFQNTELDPEANRRRMETLCKRMEDLGASLGQAGGTADAALSPTTRLAAMLKEALAANTIGGRVDEGSRLNAALEDVRQAQQAWTRIGFVPDEARRGLSDRFQRAVRKILDKQPAQQGRPRPPAGTRPR